MSAIDIPMTKLLKVINKKLSPRTETPLHEKKESISFLSSIILIVLNKRRATASFMMPSPKIIEWSLGNSLSLMILSTETVSVAVRVAASWKPIKLDIFSVTFALFDVCVKTNHQRYHIGEWEEAHEGEDGAYCSKEKNVVEIFCKNLLFDIFGSVHDDWG